MVLEELGHVVMVGSESHGGVCKNGVLNFRDMSGGMFLIKVGMGEVVGFCPLSTMIIQS